MNDRLTAAITDNGGFRIYATVTTGLVRKAQKIHGCFPVASAALGRTLTAAALIGAMQKEDNASVTIMFKGDGPLGTVLAVGNSMAEVKGWVQNPSVILPLNSAGKLDVGGGIGNGLLSVVRDSGNGAQPYTGQVELVSGEIAEDLTSYFAISEQTPSAVGLGVIVDTDNVPAAAGGYIVQMMPGRDPDDDKMIETIEKNIAEMPPVSSLAADGLTPSDIIGKILNGIKYSILNELTPVYKCSCSRERVERALISIGAADLKKMITEDNGTTVECHFCNEKYSFTAAELEKLLSRCKH